jgi:hypothetical protein
MQVWCTADTLYCLLYTAFAATTAQHNQYSHYIAQNMKNVMLVLCSTGAMLVEIIGNKDH